MDLDRSRRADEASGQADPTKKALFSRFEGRIQLKQAGAKIIVYKDGQDSVVSVFGCRHSILSWRDVGKWSCCTWCFSEIMWGLAAFLFFSSPEARAVSLYKNDDLNLSHLASRICCENHILPRNAVISESYSLDHDIH